MRNSWYNPTIMEATLDDLLGGDEPSKESGRNQQGGRYVLKPGPGRPKGVPNKLTVVLRTAIREACSNAGDVLAEEARKAGKPFKSGGGPAAYMEWLSRAEPRAFATLVGKLLPTQIVGDDEGGPVKIERIERVIVAPKKGEAK